MTRSGPRIPSEQRKRKRIELTLGEEAHGILKSKDNASEYVEELVLDDVSREGVSRPERS